jgi:3-dehydrosphinganine reductase
MGGFDGRRAMVTGASSGIGRAVAVSLAREGAHVIAAGRDLGRLGEVVAEMRAVATDPQRILDFASFDVTESEAVRGAVPGVLERLGGLDLLVTCHGYSRPGWAHVLDDSVYDEMIRVNYLGHVHVVRAFLPHFLEQGRGDVCMLSSMLGFMGSFGYTAYCGSKYAIAGFAEALRHELHPHGVRVELFYPPTTRTPGLDNENRTKPPAVWAYESESGFNKVYTAEQVATAVLGAVRSGRFENVVGLDSWFLFTMFRWFPSLARWMSDGEAVKATRKAAERERSAE